VKIPVAIVVDYPRMRENLCALIETTPDLRCAGVYRSGEEALTGISREPPQVVLMDIGLPGLSGVETVARLKLKCPSLLILMLTVYEEDDTIFRALKAGANGYLLKRCPPDELLSGIAEVRALAEAGPDLWVGCMGGVLRNGADLELRKVSPMLALALSPGAPGSIWAGLGHCEGRSGYAFGAVRFGDSGQGDPGVERVTGLPEVEVTAMLEDRGGLLWAGTAGAGLYVRQGEHWQVLGRAEGLPSQHVSALIEDNLGFVWASTPAGLARLDPHRQPVAASAGERIACVAFAGDQGLEEISFEGRSQPRACQTTDGRLWFASLKGLLEVNPDRVEPAPPPCAW
jgi:CheY-like chemotaxis protein